MPSPKLWKKAEFNVGKMSAIGRPDGGRTRELATKIGSTKKVVPKVRVELTRGCPHRFLSCIGVVPASPSVSGMVLSGLGIYIWGRFFVPFGVA